MTSYIQVVTTVATQHEAQQMARRLVAERLAACVQVGGPIESVYWWQGNIDSGSEWVCTMKSRADLWLQLEARIRQLHSYQTPEILSFAVLAGSAGYLDWLERELLPRPSTSQT